MDDWKSNQSAENELDGIIWTRRQRITHLFDIDAKRVPSSKMTQWTAAINKHMHKTPSLFLVFHFYEALKMRNCACCCFFVLLNNPEKDIKELWIIRSHGFFAPKKVNAHGLSNFIESRKNLRKTRLVWSRGFNEPKKVNAHGLSNFRESRKNLRKTPTWCFFVVSPDGPKKS